MKTTSLNKLLGFILALLLALSTAALAIGANITTALAHQEETVALSACCSLSYKTTSNIAAPPPAMALAETPSPHSNLDGSNSRPPSAEFGGFGTNTSNLDATEFSLKDGVFSITTTEYAYSYFWTNIQLTPNAYYVFSAYLYTTASFMGESGIIGVVILTANGVVNEYLFFDYNRRYRRRIEHRFFSGSGDTRGSMWLIHGHPSDDMSAVLGTSYFYNPTLIMDWTTMGCSNASHSTANNIFSLTTDHFCGAFFTRTVILSANTYYRFSAYVYSNATYFRNGAVIGIQIAGRDGAFNRAHYYHIAGGGWQKLEVTFFNDAAREAMLRLLHGFNMGDGVGLVRGTTMFKHINLERLEVERDNNWRILAVIARETDITMMLSGRLQTVRISMSEQDVAIARNSFYRLADSLNTMSNGQMNATVEILEISTPISEMQRLWPQAYGVDPRHMHDILNRYVDTTEFDHISSFLRILAPGAPIIPTHWAGYYSPNHIRGVSYSFTRFSDMADCNFHIDEFFPDHIPVHEIIHAIENLSRQRGIAIPRGSIDNPVPYRGRTFGFFEFEDRKQWYTDVMNQNVFCPIRQQYIGFTEESYLLNRFTVASVAYSRVSPPVPLGNVYNLTLGNDRVLNWQRVENAVGYHVYVRGVRVTANPVVDTSFCLSELNFTEGQSNIQVRAVGNALIHGVSALSSSVVFTTLYAPVARVAQNAGLILWEPVNLSDRFYIYLGDEALDVGLITGHFFDLSDLDLAPGIHYFQVRAVTDAFNMGNSALSQQVRFVVSSVLDAPVFFNTEQGSTILSWQPVEHNRGFVLYLNNVRIYMLAADTLSFDVAILGLGAGEYNFTVRAIGDGEVFLTSELSETISVIIPRSNRWIFTILLPILIVGILVISGAIIATIMLRKRKKI